jgi:hypothetical protein
MIGSIKSAVASPHGLRDPVALSDDSGLNDTFVVFDLWDSALREIATRISAILPEVIDCNKG